jgi:hypothetical protein
MSKVIKITVACPQCGCKLAVPVTEGDVGTNKQGSCPKCHKSFLIPIPASWKAKFDSDPTEIGCTTGELSLLLETIPNQNTAYQSFELTSDFYTIGRKNNSGPEFRSDVEVVTKDLTMSRIHAAITRKGNTGFTLKDISKKNGITINNEQEKMDKNDEIYLSDGDTFCLGQTRFRVSITNQGLDEDLTR